MLQVTYWNHNGKHQATYERLQKLIPDAGAVVNPAKNKQLERLRKMVNCYYDLYNNGLCNRKAAFNKLYDIRPSYWAYPQKGEYDPEMYALVEVKIDQQILLAAEEQDKKLSLA